MKRVCVKRNEELRNALNYTEDRQSNKSLCGFSAYFAVNFL